MIPEPTNWLVRYPPRLGRSFSDTQELERLGIRAYEGGDLRLAHFFVDRISRIGIARADLLCLKADLAVRLGFKALAVEILGLTLAIDPDNFHANARLVSLSADAIERVRAAEQVVRLSKDNWRAIRSAIAVLRQAAREIVVTGQIVESEFVGWVTWNGKSSISLQADDGRGERELTVGSEPNGPWPDLFDHFGRFRLTLRADHRPVHLAISAGDTMLCRLSIFPIDRPLPVTGPQRADHSIDADLTVIVPIYDDFEATRNCLDSLRPQLDASKRIRAILVNDATPDDRIARLLERLVDEAAFTVVHNDTNLGFAGAVNRALAMVTRGDVVVLNADTVLPAGAIEELARAGRSAPDIGTVTPLSNNGEYTSFPDPFRVNDLRSLDSITEIDRAAKVNRDVVVDLPNGIGFCLLLTRRCLEGVGQLPQLYDRGYFEDVDFCLRARQSGLRNVCAPWIYVGHAGSRSFRDEKRSLVMCNLKKLEDRFPDYNNESVAFTKFDPLQPYRGAIERELLRITRFDRLIFCPNDLVAEVTMERARHLAATGVAVMLCILSTADGSAMLRSAGEGYPRSLQFSVRSAEDLDALIVYLSELNIDRFEFAGHSQLMIEIIQRSKHLRKPSDILVVDVASIDLRVVLEEPQKKTRVRKPKSSQKRSSSAPANGRYIAPNHEARAFMVSERIAADSIDLALISALGGRSRAIFSDSPRVRCGVVLDERCPSAFRSLLEMMRRLASEKKLEFFVLGATLNDDCLMSAGNVFVLGPTKADESATLADIYRFQAMLIYLPRPVFAWSKAEAAWELGLPTAYFEWPFTPNRLQTNLPINPSWPVATLAGRLSSWLLGSESEAVDAA